MNDNEYQCAVCGNIYQKGWSDEEAIKEMSDDFGNYSVEECDIVCDDCYKTINDDMSKRGLFPSDFYKEEKGNVNKNDGKKYFTNFEWILVHIMTKFIKIVHKLKNQKLYRFCYRKIFYPSTFYCVEKALDRAMTDKLNEWFDNMVDINDLDIDIKENGSIHEILEV